MCRPPLPKVSCVVGVPAKRACDDAGTRSALRCELVRRLVTGVAQMAEALALLALSRSIFCSSAEPRRRPARARLVERPATAEHRLLDWRRSPGRRAEILADLLDLAHDTSEEVEVAFERATGSAASSRR